MKIEMKYMWNGLSQTDVSWITDKCSNPVQYMHYLPYGQLLANQKATTYDEHYKFIGKERGWESGYDYFGARYYISPFLHWMSVDPLSDEDPGISPYANCAWNPVRLVDYDGLDTYEFDGSGDFTGHVIKQDGDHIGRIHLSEDNYIDFSFNDQKQYLKQNGWNIE